MQLEKFTDEDREKISLILLLMGSWPEEDNHRGAWKSHDARTLHSLEEQGWLYVSGASARSCSLSPEGIEYARDLMAELLNKKAF